VQAAIGAAHTDDEVPWEEVIALYDLLLSLAPGPVVRLNRALAVAHVEGPEAALELVDDLDLASYHPWHVARAHLLGLLGRDQESREALDAALALDPTPLERAHLERLRGRAARLRES
jgi:RNA polymerase sigma-70 factor (ECF subfamily)